MRYLVKAVTDDVITTTESNDLAFIVTLFTEYYNSEIHYDKIDLVDNTTGEILAYFYEDKGKIEFYWTLSEYSSPDIIF